MMKQNLVYLIFSASLVLPSLNACQKPQDIEQAPKQASTVIIDDTVMSAELPDNEVQESPAPDEAPSDCIVKPKEQPVACTMDYRPVCGCDAKTYPNACSAGAAGVPRITQGACEGNDLN